MDLYLPSHFVHDDGCSLFAKSYVFFPSMFFLDLDGKHFQGTVGQNHILTFSKGCDCAAFAEGRKRRRTKRLSIQRIQPAPVMAAHLYTPESFHSGTKAAKSFRLLLIAAFSSPFTSSVLSIHPRLGVFLSSFPPSPHPHCVRFAPPVFRQRGIKNTTLSPVS